MICARPRLASRAPTGHSALAALGVLLVLVALLGGLPALHQLVARVRVRVAPLAQPVLEARQQHDRDRVR